MTISVTITESGRTWTAAEVDALAITWTDAPLDDLSEALRAKGYRVTEVAGIGLSLYATVERMTDTPIVDALERRYVRESWSGKRGGQ